MRNSKEYFELRNHALNFLDRYFTQDAVKYRKGSERNLTALLIQLLSG